jgi:DNA-binding HxlR family transcriptional regulator
MDYLAQDPSNCSVGRAVALVGQPWVILILRDVSQGLRRFSDLQDHLGVSRSVLSDRLEHMVASGILELRDYQEPGSRRRSEYRLTEMGRDLYPALTALRVWGDKYLADPEGPASEILHRGCGAQVHTALMCAEGHVLQMDELERRPGAGARMRAA